MKVPATQLVVTIHAEDGDEEDINRLLRQHRDWIKPVTLDLVHVTEIASHLRFVRRTGVPKAGQPSIVGFVVLIPAAYLSLRQVLVRDYCIEEGPAREQARELLEEQITWFAQKWRLQQAFCTNSNEVEQAELIAVGWRKVGPTVLVRDILREEVS